MSKVYPRFKSRSILTSHKSSRNNSLGQVTSLGIEKECCFFYSQMRIALFHVLKTCLIPNSVVASSSYTIYDINNIIKNAGHTPLLVDIDLNNLGPDIDELINAVASRKVSCVIFTHLHGYSVDLTELSDVCKRYKCLLIEDCAQSLWNHSWSQANFIPGKYGDIALFSTGFFKNVNTISGGLLYVSSSSIYKDLILNDYAKLSSNFSFDFLKRLFYSFYFSILTNNIIFNQFTYPLLRFSFLNKIEFFNKRAREENSPHFISRTPNDILKMNALQNWLYSKKKIQDLDKDFLKKKKIASIYISELAALLENKTITIPGHSSKNILNMSCLNQIPLLVEDRESLLEYLFLHKHDIAAQHINDLSIDFSYFSIVPNDCLHSRYVAKRIILLPCYPDFPAEEAVRLCTSINKYFS